MAERFSIRRQPGFTAVAMICFVILYVPILVLVVYAFNAANSMSEWGGFSLHWFEVGWNNDQVIDASLRSLKIASAAAILASIVATMAALATTRRGPYRGLTFIYGFINQPLMVPEIVTGVALLVFFSRVKVWSGYSGLGYLIAAHTAFCIPFAYLPIRARLEDMDLTLEQAAADLYATPWQAFRRVTFPLLMPGITSGLALAFIVSIDDFTITQMVMGPGQTTLPIYIWSQLHRSGVTPEINAISAILLAVSIFFVSLSFLIGRKRK
jgi:spermidine/putrescine transport system permease protein